MRKRTVTIVIPNWNGEKLLRRHLPQVLRAARDAQVLVVDDASTDGSVALLAQKFPMVRVVARRQRRGFAAAVNSGVRLAAGDIVVLLNTDVKPEQDFLMPLISHFSDESVFAVGCLEKSVEGVRTVARGRGEAGWKKGFYIHKRGEVNRPDTAWVSGGSGAFRKQVWNTLGGMDELYNPFYWEDIDISYRARKAGFKTLFEPGSVVWHYHDEGKIKSEYSPRFVRRVAYRNQYIFIWKNLSDIRLIAAHLFWNKVRLLQAISRGDWPMLVGFFEAFFFLPSILAHRFGQRKFWKVSDRQL